MLLMYNTINTPMIILFALFFLNTPATTEIYTLSLHDALPISHGSSVLNQSHITARALACAPRRESRAPLSRDRKSTRLNSSHTVISYAVFCLKKKKKHL